MRLRRLLAGRSGLPLLIGLPVLLAGCTSIAGPTTSFGDIFWSFVAFFFWFMAIWIFITIFGDIFRRNDLTGGMKAVWIIVLCILPFLGAIIYMVARPKVTAQDVQLMTQAEAAAKAAAAVSPADEIAKLQELRTAGVLSEEEFNALKAKALA
ncbi:MAG: SHOCT domain-containing protein [Chloroflexota bacterium]